MSALSSLPPLLQFPIEMQANIYKNLSSKDQLCIAYLVCKKLKENAQPIFSAILQNRQFSNTQDFDPRVFILFEYSVTKFVSCGLKLLIAEKKTIEWKNIADPVVRLASLDPGIMRICSEENANNPIDISVPAINKTPQFFFHIPKDQMTSLRKFKSEDSNFRNDFKSLIGQVTNRLLLLMHSLSHRTVYMNATTHKKIVDNFESRNKIAEEAIESCEISDIFLMRGFLVIQGTKLCNLTRIVLTQILENNKKISNFYLDNLLERFEGSFKLENKQLQFNKTLFFDLRNYINDPVNEAKSVLENKFKSSLHFQAAWSSIDSDGNFNHNLFLIFDFFLSCKLVESQTSKKPRLSCNSFAYKELEKALTVENRDIWIELDKFFNDHPNYLHFMPILFPHLKIAAV